MIMNAEYLLRELKQANEIKISQYLLSQIPEFKTGKDVLSMESVALTISGHQPIKNYSFDINKLQNWCEENYLCFCLNEQEQIFHLKSIQQ